MTSRLAAGLQGNQILKIAYEVRAMKAAGERLGDFTIGDFHASEFRIPEQVAEGIKHYIDQGLTNYPPSMGVMALREAVRKVYMQDMQLDADIEQVLVSSGTRPLIYAGFRAIVDPGDKVIYGVPSWNTNHYVYLSQAEQAEITTRPEDNFMLTLEQIEPHFKDAVLLCLNTPMNPSGTMMDREKLTPIVEGILAENARRQQNGRKPLYVLYDQVYWRITHGSEHIHPAMIDERMAQYTLYMDGASKNYGGTGLRVGWAVVPKSLAKPMAHIVAHMGAWAPKAEQLSLADFLPKREENLAYFDALAKPMRKRLEGLHAVFQKLKQEGLPIDSIEPQGGLFLSICLGVRGKTTPTGETLETPEDVRQYVLKAGKSAFVPFGAFGDQHNLDWFRASVSGIVQPDYDYALPELESALRALK